VGTVFLEDLFTALPLGFASGPKRDMNSHANG
jgi:hypothetical protein